MLMMIGTSHTVQIIMEKVRVFFFVFHSSNNNYSKKRIGLVATRNLKSYLCSILKLRGR